MHERHAGDGRAASATAQTAPFPTKPIRIVIPFAAGGFADITMRVLADKLGERLNQRVIIENRPGGGGVVAAQAVTSSPADGYTLFVLAVGTAISVALFKSLRFDAQKDFAPISTVAHFDMSLLTKASSPIRTLDELLADARKRGEAMDIGTTLAGSSQFLAGALFRSVADIKITQVPFRTTPDVLLALLRGDIDVAVESTVRSNPRLTTARCVRSSLPARPAHCQTYRPRPKPACLASRSWGGTRCSRRRGRRPDYLAAQQGSRRGRGHAGSA